MIKAPSDNPTDASAETVRLPWESLDSEDDAPVGAGLQEPAAQTAGGPAGSTSEAASTVAATSTDTFVVDDTEADGESDVQVPLEAGDVARHSDHDDFDPIEYESPLPAEPLMDDLGPPPRGGGWTVVSLCLGIGIIACCVLIPQADANRRLAYERQKLTSDLESIRKQVATNDEFLRRVADDPNLAERLAQRQMKIIRQGTRVLELKKTAQQAGATGAAAGPARATNGLTPDEMSPFHLVQVAPPPPMPPYQPRGGVIAGLCHRPRSRLYLIGTGLFLMAVGLVLGFGPRPADA